MGGGHTGRGQGGAARLLLWVFLKVWLFEP